MGISWFIDILDSDKEERVNASMYCIQTILNTLSGMTNNESDKPVQDLCDKYSFMREKYSKKVATKLLNFSDHYFYRVWVIF